MRGRIVPDTRPEVVDEAGAVACSGEVPDNGLELGNQLVHAWVGPAGRLGVEIEVQRADMERDGEEDAVDGRLGRGNTALPAELDSPNAVYREEVG